MFAAAIGTIGLPECHSCVDSLVKVLRIEDEDPNVKAMAVWSIGRLASHETAVKAKKVLAKAL